jgi:hypothetical protein
LEETIPAGAEVDKNGKNAIFQKRRLRVAQLPAKVRQAILIHSQKDT